MAFASVIAIIGSLTERLNKIADICFHIHYIDAHHSLIALKHQKAMSCGDEGSKFVKTKVNIFNELQKYRANRGWYRLNMVKNAELQPHGNTSKPAFLLLYACFILSWYYTSISPAPK